MGIDLEHEQPKNPRWIAIAAPIVMAALAVTTAKAQEADMGKAFGIDTGSVGIATPDNTHHATLPDIRVMSFHPALPPSVIFTGIDLGTGSKAGTHTPPK